MVLFCIGLAQDPSIFKRPEKTDQLTRMICPPLPPPQPLEVLLRSVGAGRAGSVVIALDSSLGTSLRLIVGERVSLLTLLNTNTFYV